MIVTQGEETPAPSDGSRPVSLLILGAGWTSTFLIPLLRREGVRHAATTTDGRDRTIRFRFDPADPSNAAFAALPAARTVLITFPLRGAGQAARLVRGYAETHPPPPDGDGKGSRGGTRYVQLGATSIWGAPGWQDENDAYDAADPRAVAEDELLRVCGGPAGDGDGDGGAAVLSLAGLYGGDRQPRDWVARVIRSKEELRAKGALHVVHGEDVARAVLALHRNFTPGKRWIVCDMHVYDWWDLVQDWATQAVTNPDADKKAKAEGELEAQRELLGWVGELMVEEGVRALPRDTAAVGRRLDGRGFWHHMGLWPTQGRMR